MKVYGKEPFNILIVDDDKVLGEQIARLLGDESRKIVVASNGQSALDVIKEYPGFNVIISDFHMPQMTGMQLHSKLREQLIEIPFFIFTGGLDLIPQSELCSLDTSSVYEKPLGLAKIRKKIEEMEEKAS